MWNGKHLHLPFMDKSIMFAWNITEGFLKQARDLLRPEGMFSLSLSISLLCKSRQSGFYQRQDRITIATIIRSLWVSHGTLVSRHQSKNLPHRNEKHARELITCCGKREWGEGWLKEIWRVCFPPNFFMCNVSLTRCMWWGRGGNFLFIFMLFYVFS